MRLALLVLVACSHPAQPTPAPPKAVVVISANTEWKVVKALYPSVQMQPTPWGETFEQTIETSAVPSPSRSCRGRRGIFPACHAASER